MVIKTINSDLHYFGPAEEKSHQLIRAEQLQFQLETAFIVQLLRDKIVRFLIKASNLAGLLASIGQIFPDLEPCQIFFQNHGMRMSKIWHTMPLHGNEAEAKDQFFLPSGTTMPSILLF